MISHNIKTGKTGSNVVVTTSSFQPRPETNAAGHRAARRLSALLKGSSTLQNDRGSLSYEIKMLEPRGEQIFLGKWISKLMKARLSMVLKDILVSLLATSCSSIKLDYNIG